MSKICLKDGCNYPRHSHGYCKIHSYLRTDDEYLRKKEAKKSAPTKRKRIPLMSKVRQDKLTALHALDRALWMEIWDERPHVCLFCGRFLGEEPLTTFFHHPCEKAKFPEIRFNKENIVLTCLQCHSECHSANPTTKMIELKIELITHFKSIGLL